MRQRLLSVLLLVLATKARAGGAAPHVSAYSNPTADATTSAVMLPIASPVRIALFSSPARKWQIDVPVSATTLAASTH